MSDSGKEADKPLCDKVDSLKLTELKEELKKRKMKTSGNKDELITRLKTVLAIEDEHGDKDEEDEEDIEDGGEENLEDNDYEDQERSSEDDSRHGRTRRRRTKHLLTFKDVEETMETFSGDNSISVKEWLKEFEELAALCDWSDIQKVIYGKRLLSGPAKLFIKFEKCTKTWF